MLNFNVHINEQTGQSPRIKYCLRIYLNAIDQSLPNFTNIDKKKVFTRYGIKTTVIRTFNIEISNM